jgi:glycerol uptake facilitator-like aquaporin
VNSLAVRRALGAELLGSAVLALVVVGSGIAAQRLSPTDVGLQLSENAAVTALGLYVLITLLGPISGAHFNPVVTLLAWSERTVDAGRALAYVLAQVVGCAAGAVLANALFALPLVTLSHKARASGPHALAEVVATAGLVLVIGGLVRLGRVSAVASGVACYIGAAYFFTSSTSFANPAITVGRTLSNSFAGIAPSSAPLFIGAQVVGALGAILVLRALAFRPPEVTREP